jgi:hypothetical protein
MTHVVDAKRYDGAQFRKWAFGDRIATSVSRTLAKLRWRQYFRGWQGGSSAGIRSGRDSL